MQDIQPKQLRQVTSGRIFSYSPVLAKRKDMVPVWPHNVDPNYDGPVGLAVDTQVAQSDQLRAALKERDKIISEAGNVIAEREAQIAELKEQLQTANQQINSLMNKIGIGEGKNAPVSDPARQLIIDQAVAEIIRENNPEDFTKSGLPRTESVAARCGFDEVGASERDLALENYTAKKD